MWIRSQNKDLLIDVKAIYWGKKAYVDSYMVCTKVYYAIQLQILN